MRKIIGPLPRHGIFAHDVPVRLLRQVFELGHRQRSLPLLIGVQCGFVSQSSNAVL